MAIRASARFDGAENDEVQNLPSAGDVQRSTDYQPSNTVEVQRGFFKQTVSSADELQDSDMVTVDGIEINAKMAREMGLMGEVFRPIRKPDDLDQSLSSGAAAQQREALDEQQSEGTGNEAYDEAAKGLREALEAGLMEHGEAFEYDTVVAQTAMAGMTVDAAVKTLSDLQDGTVSTLDIGSENATMLQNAEAKVTQAASKSAQAELGREGFDAIRQAANASPEVNDAIRTVNDPRVDAAFLDEQDCNRGFFGCVHHYVIRTGGQIEIGRDPKTRSSSGRRHLHPDHIAVGVVGGLEEDGRQASNATEAQEAALEWLLQSLADTLQVDLEVTNHLPMVMTAEEREASEADQIKNEPPEPHHHEEDEEEETDD